MVCPTRSLVRSIKPEKTRRDFTRDSSMESGDPRSGRWHPWGSAIIAARARCGLTGVPSRLALRYSPLGRPGGLLAACIRMLESVLAPSLELTVFHRSHTIAQDDPDVWEAIAAESQRQEDHIELIASENYVSAAVLAAQGSQLTNKYAEGYPGRRYY